MSSGSGQSKRRGEANVGNLINTTKASKQKLNEIKNFLKGKLTENGQTKKIPDDDTELNDIENFNIENIEDCKEEENIESCTNRVVGYTMKVVDKYKKKARDIINLEKQVDDETRQKAERVDAAEAALAREKGDITNFLRELSGIESNRDNIIEDFTGEILGNNPRRGPRDDGKYPLPPVPTTTILNTPDNFDDNVDGDKKVAYTTHFGNLMKKKKYFYNKLLAEAKNKILEVKGQAERAIRAGEQAAQAVETARAQVVAVQAAKKQIQTERINNLKTLKTTILPSNRVKNILTDDVSENIFTPVEGEDIQADIQIPPAPNDINLEIDPEDADLDRLVTEKVDEFNGYVGSLLSRNKSIYDKTVRLAKRKIQSETTRARESEQVAERARDAAQGERDTARGERDAAQASLQTCNTDKTTIYNKFKRILTPPRQARVVPEGGAAVPRVEGGAAVPQAEGGAALEGGIFKIFDPTEIDTNDDEELIQKISQFSPRSQAPPGDLNTSENIETAIRYLQGEIGRILPSVGEFNENLDINFYRETAEREPGNIYEGLSKEEQNYKFLNLIQYGTGIIKKNDYVHKIIIGKALLEKLKAKQAVVAARAEAAQRIQASEAEAAQRIQASEAARQASLQESLRRVGAAQASEAAAEQRARDALEAERQRLIIETAELKDLEKRLEDQEEDLREQLGQVGQIQAQFNQATQRIQELESELAKKSISYKIKEGTKTYISEPIKEYYKDENFSTRAKWIMFIIICFCILFIILGIYYMIKIINTNSRVIKNKDKNEEIITNIFKS